MNTPRRAMLAKDVTAPSWIQNLIRWSVYTMGKGLF